MDVSETHNFLFSSKYRVWRHVAFWVAHTVFFTLVWLGPGQTVGAILLANLIWLPMKMLYCYPIMYWAIPKYLLKEKYWIFSLILTGWIVLGASVNYLFKAYVFMPVQEILGFETTNKSPWQAGTFLALTTTVGITSMIVLFKHWLKKQQEWLQAEKEKATAELQLLKAQVHPHFLFNTLNNIYSFSLEHSPKTPDLILKLSSLLSYMLYDCKAEQVPLEKELEVMKDYIDLERERYGNKIEVSWNIEGDTENKYISPLLLLPFLENAFKHGTSDQLEKPWLSFDLVIKQNAIKCKVVNSKNEFMPLTQHGIGIENVKKRLEFLYRGKHEIKINDEGDFFVVSLMLELENYKTKPFDISNVSEPVFEKAAV